MQYETLKFYNFIYYVPPTKLMALTYFVTMTTSWLLHRSQSSACPKVVVTVI